MNTNKTQADLFTKKEAFMVEFYFEKTKTELLNNSKYSFYRDAKREGRGGEGEGGTGIHCLSASNGIIIRVPC